MRANSIILVALGFAFVSADDVHDFNQEISQLGSLWHSQYTQVAGPALASILDVIETAAPSAYSEIVEGGHATPILGTFTNLADYADATITSIPEQQYFSGLPSSLRSELEEWQTDVLSAAQSLAKQVLESTSPATSTYGGAGAKQTTPPYVVAGGLMAAAAGAMAAIA